MACQQNLEEKRADFGNHAGALANVLPPLLFFRHQENACKVRAHGSESPSPINRQFQESAMKRILSLGLAIALIFVMVVFALQPGGGIPLLDWAKKAPAGTPRVAILLEFGNNDTSYRDWSGQATVTGAKVVHREGYRFREDDKLVGANGWQAKSRSQIRAPNSKPAVAKMETPASVGVVLHLEDVQANAKIAIEMKDGDKTDIAVSDLLAGKTQVLFKNTALARRIT